MLPCLLLLAGCETATPQPPNVLLVVLDTTRADAVLPATDPAATPRLDRLAADGVVYTHARSTSAWTVPAHGSLFTGLYPSRHGAHHESHLLREEAVTLAELLATSHTRAGFSENPHIGLKKGFAQGFEVFEETWRLERRGGGGAPAPTVQRAVDWLGTRDSTRPFLLFVNLMDPHLPYNPPDRLIRPRLPAGVDPERVEQLRNFGERDARRFVTGRGPISAEDLAVLRGLYHAEVAHVDERVGQLIDVLVRQGELDRTLVVVVGDHGENLGEHGLMEHQLCLYETLLRVPFVLALPGVFDGGERRDDAVQLVDLLPTVLEVVGLDRAQWPAVEGASLLGSRPVEARPAIAEYMLPVRQRQRFLEVDPGFDFDPFDRRLRSIQIGNLKLIVSDEGDPELYDLDQDPEELHNVADERVADAARLAARLSSWLADRDSVQAVGEPELDAETLEKLRSLGYVQ